jgi:flavodoxin I
VSYQGSLKSKESASGNFSYTFLPSLTGAFFQSLEMPRDFKEFLAGKNSAETAQITFQYFTTEGKREETFDLRSVLLLYRQRGKKIPSDLVHQLHWKSSDSAEQAALSDSELKAQSDKVRAEIAEQLRKQEEERKAQEEAAKKAAEEAAKAAAAKAAAAATKPVAAAASAAPLDRSQPTLTPGKLLLVYGSSTGNTKNVADAIKEELGDAVDHVKNITDIHPVDLAQFDKVIVGVPTWHIGEIQEDWGAVLPEIEALSFQGKRVAVFGLGDGKGYPETYVDAMAELVEKFEKKGAQLVGLWPTDGYDFKKSKAIRDGKFLGLVIDVENQDHLSDKRVKAWVSQLQKELLS